MSRRKSTHTSHTHTINLKASRNLVFYYSYDCIRVDLKHLLMSPQRENSKRYTNKVLQSYGCSVFLYESGVWILTREDESSIQAAEMKYSCQQKGVHGWTGFAMIMM